jgi:hypothetical protein
LKSKPASSTDERKTAIPVEDESEGLISEETRTTYPIGANFIELHTDKYGLIRIELILFILHPTRLVGQLELKQIVVRPQLVLHPRTLA